MNILREKQQTITLGTRSSALARTQTEWVASLLREQLPSLQINVKLVQTTGDIKQDIPFQQVEAKGMFVKEIEQALLEGSIDAGVHSLKDMPSELPNGLFISAIPRREDPRDALITYGNISLDDLPIGSKIGTSSPRRQAQLHHLRPDMIIEELRGNLDTRLKKLDDGKYIGILLAAAGLNRLGLSHRISQFLPTETFVPAAGQGALAIETRENDEYMTSLLAALNHTETSASVSAERAFLRALGGGCSLPAGAYAYCTGDTMHLVTMLASSSSSHVYYEELSGPVLRGEELGKKAATLLQQRIRL